MNRERREEAPLVNLKQLSVWGSMPVGGVVASSGHLAAYSRFAGLKRRQKGAHDAHIALFWGLAGPLITRSQMGSACLTATILLTAFD